MAAARLNPQPGERIVDCAGGTGDIARPAGEAGPGGARRGAAGRTPRSWWSTTTPRWSGSAAGGCADPEIAWSVGDAQRLPLPDASADAYVIAFGIRNVTDIPAALREARRVLKRGRRFLCLEFSRPRRPRATLGLRRVQLQRDPAGRRPRCERPRQLPVPGREHPPLPRPEALRRHDRAGGFRARGLDKLHRRRRGAAPRLGGLGVEAARAARPLTLPTRLRRAGPFPLPQGEREDAASTPRPLREREGPAAKRWEGEGSRHAGCAPA